jgi:hypothetical protein
MYPIQYEADHVERHSRLTTFFRYFMAIPAAIFTMLYGLVAYLAVIAAWFAMVFTGRYPEGLYDFMAGYLRNATRANAYYYLVTDRYPPFDGNPDDSYPVRVHIGPPLEHYSRAKAFFRAILAIPVLIIAYCFSLVAQMGAFAAWFVIVFTGKMPKGLQDVIDMGLRYVTRSSAYYLLLTETWPPFTDESPPSTLPAAPSPQPLQPVAGFEPPVAPPAPPRD